MCVCGGGGGGEGGYPNIRASPAYSLVRCVEGLIEWQLIQKNIDDWNSNLF